EAHDQRQAGRAARLRLHRRSARSLGLPLPSALSHGDGHVPHGARVVNAPLSARALSAWVGACLLAFGFANGAAAQMQMPQDSNAAPFGPPVMDQHVFYHLMLNQLEGRLGDSSSFRWSGEAWLGTDEHRLWLRSEGRLANG